MKTQIQLTILILFLFIKAYPHQDTFYKYKYDNVSVIIQTGFFNEEVNNVKIIGQYASLLCEQTQYKGQVFLFFGQDYIPGNESVNQTFMSYQNDYIYEILGFKSTNIDSYDSILLNNNEKIVIQQFDFQYNIKETLEMLYFAFDNTELLKSDIENCKALGYDIITINEKIIDSVKHLNSDRVNEVLLNKVNIIPKEEIEIDKGFYVSYYSQYGKYILIDNNEIIIDTLSQILMLGYERDWLVDYVVALESKNDLSIYSDRYIQTNGFVKYKNHQTDLINFDEGISDLRLTILDQDILLIEFFNWYGGYTDMKFIYLLHEDKLITDFMDYINDKRIKK